MQAAADGVATGAVTIASRDVQLNGVAVRKGKWLGLADGEPVAGGETFDEVAQAVLERLLREPRGVLTLLIGESPPSLDGLLSGSRPSIPTSSSTCIRGASRTTRSCWRLNDAGPGRPRRGQRHVPPDAGAALRPA